MLGLKGLLVELHFQLRVAFGDSNYFAHHLLQLVLAVGLPVPHHQLLFQSTNLHLFVVNQ